MRPRLAPSAARMAISFWRAAPRAEQQTRDVGARDHQQKRHRSGEHQERRTDGAENVGDREQNGADLRIGVGIALREALLDGVHLGLRLGDGDAILQAREDAVAALAAAGMGHVVIVRDPHVHAADRPQFGAAARPATL